jgi:acyl-CoA synthetase (AMP-forming)/AMP-acid ligase II
MKETQIWWGAKLLRKGDPDALWAQAHGQVTIGELRAEVGGLAQTMIMHGIRARNTVALEGTASFTHLWTILALWSLGAQVLLFEPLDAPERAALLKMCAPQFFVTVGGDGYRPDVFADECEVLVQRLADGRPAHSSHCVIHFSSGTTGQPKAIGRTPESLLGELGRWRALNGMHKAGERVAVLGSVAHSFGLVGGLLCALDAEAAVVFPAAQTPGAIAEAAANAHVVMGNPRHFDQLAGADDGALLPDLRLAISGGDVLPRQVYIAFSHRYGVPIGQAYGTIETGVIATHLAGGLGATTIGLPVPGAPTRVVNGILEVYLPQSPYPYEARHWSGGWMSTGDLVTRDPDTQVLRLRGRVQKAGHTDLDLLEIESVLVAHEQITDAVVFGVEPIEAHVESAANLDYSDLEPWCRRFLDDDAVPACYHVVRKLPRTINGKARRIRLLPHKHRGNGDSLPAAAGSESPLPMSRPSLRCLPPTGILAWPYLPRPDVDPAVA